MSGEEGVIWVYIWERSIDMGHTYKASILVIVTAASGIGNRSWFFCFHFDSSTTAKRPLVLDLQASDRKWVACHA